MQYSLFIHPAIPHREFSRSELQNFLQDHGFIDNNDEASSSFAPGPELMEHITFLGCSPMLSTGQIECSIAIHQFDRVTGLGGESIETLRYPRCKHPLVDTAQLLAGFPDARWQCPQCANQGDLSEINWRKSAGFSDSFIELTSIFPKEAVPASGIIQSLQEFSHSDWSWFYSRSQHPS